MMTSLKGLIYLAVLALLASVCHTAIGSDASDGDVSALAISVDANGDDTASIPDFDGDGTIGFGDFVIFAGVFGARQGDEKYEATHDLNGDGEIEFSDFVIFAQNFGKDVHSPVVTIPDANLRAAIAAALGKASGAPITQADMATLDSLEANDADISDLSGLEFAVNLKWLDLSSNKITDISILEGLTNLTDLTLSSNNISDLAGLVANTGLGREDTVDVADNPLNVTSQITHIPSLRARGVSISFVAPAVTIPDANLRAAIETALSKDSDATITRAEMATMDSLEASDADIDDLTGLESAVNLTYLSLNDNNITNISALGKSTKLERLWLSNNRIEDISALSKLANLTELWLWNNQIEDISALSGLTNLTRLSLGRNNITDTSALSGLTNLTMLILKSNHISDLAPLAANKGLGRGVTVDVTDNPLNAASESMHIPALQTRGVSVSFAPSPAVVIPDANLRAAIKRALGKASGAPITVADMKRLTNLSGWGAGIRDLTGLEFATNLTELEISHNGITDISALSGLTNLSWLLLSGNPITDISALSGLTDLTWLEIISIDLTDISALRGLTKLTSLNFYANDITDISVLAGLTNLESLFLGDNDLTDISALRGLTKLTSLSLRLNDITDISVLAGLTNLRWLSVTDTNITDISVLKDLTNLEDLYLAGNDITDISALAGLTNLKRLHLEDNDITDISVLKDFNHLIELDLAFNFRIRDISVLVGLTRLTTLEIRGNPLSDSSINDHIPALKSNGVTVLYDFWRVVGDFDIEIVLLSPFTEPQKEELQWAVRRWMAVITKDLPDYTFTQNWSGRCGGQSYEIPSGERIDDLRIYVIREEMEVAGWGGPTLLREETHLPVLGCMAFNSEAKDVQYLTLHEAAHVLGFGTIWDDLGLIQNFSRDDPNADAHFNGPLAIAAFDDAGGRGYTGKKVPVSQDGGHWRGPVLNGELMGGGGALSAITVQSMADLGYGVDVAQADPYTLPGATQASAKIALAQPSVTVPGFDIAWAYPDVLPGAERYGQGRIVSNLPSIVGDDGQTGRLQSAERVWGLGMNFNFADERRMWGAAPPASAEPELTCGAALINEPIYVIDPQGRVVSTIRQ